MVCILSLVLAVLLVFVGGNFIRKNANICYCFATVISVAVILVTWLSVRLPAMFASRIWPIFARGGLAGALFIIVMITGALPNGSSLIKRLMPIRGQLSIIACILTLGHNIAYGKTYFVKLFTAASDMPINQLLAACCSVVMLIVMLPLFVTSFPTVRRRFQAKKWKRLQRWAYLFYGLLYCHIMLLNYSRAQAGVRVAQITVIVYSLLFGGYALCRICKAVAIRNKLQNKLVRWQSSVVASWILIVAVVFVGVFVYQPEEVVVEASEISDIDESTVVSEMSVVDESTEVLEMSDIDESTVVIEVSETETIEVSVDSVYNVYTGKAMGMNAPITVEVTVDNGQITDIVIVSSKEDEPYLSDSLVVIDDILSSGSTDVDVVSGATYTSGGIIDAVKNALEGK